MFIFFMHACVTVGEKSGDFRQTKRARRGPLSAVKKDATSVFNATLVVFSLVVVVVAFERFFYFLLSSRRSFANLRTENDASSSSSLFVVVVSAFV